jgi:hypothetical protein
MTLKIKTADIELEYSDEVCMIDENAKKRVIEIIDKLYSYRVVHFDKPLPTVFPSHTFGTLSTRLD